MCGHSKSLSNFVYLLFCCALCIMIGYVATMASPTGSFRVLSTGQEIACNGASCTFCLSGKRLRPPSSQRLLRRRREHSNGNQNRSCDEWKKSGRVTLELGVFADHALYQEFYRRDPSNSTMLKAQIQEYIFSIVQQGKELFASPSLTPKVNIEIVEFKIILHKFRRFSHQKVQQDMPSYMDAFCHYQQQLNVPKRWDHAVLFTGFDLTHSLYMHQASFAGYSSAKSACGHLSCSIVEASTFKSAYTLVHELGHSLGMEHDNGSDTCPADCCVMSPIILSGSQNWSRCSVSEFQEYLESIPCDKFCLNEPNKSLNLYKPSFTLPPMPGQAYTAFDQCRHFFGPCSKPYVNYNMPLESICSELWCTYHDGTVRLAHAALEGTYCAEGKWCRFGKCTSMGTPLATRQGQWSAWIPVPVDGTCGDPACSKPIIYGQLSIKRQLRSCSNPSPNNGGAECQGDVFRGIICNNNSDFENLIDVVATAQTHGHQTVAHFASKICTAHKKRIESENGTAITLSGEGFQRAGDSKEPNACYVWCSTVNLSFTSYTFFDPLPDGVPCGANRFCVSGKCMEHRRCNSTLSLISSEIPSDCEPINASESSESTKVPTFSAWSPWSSCSRSCGIGIRRRSRQCTPANLLACSNRTNSHQVQFCRGLVNQCTGLPLTTTSMISPGANDMDNGIEAGKSTLIEALNDNNGRNSNKLGALISNQKEPPFPKIQNASTITPATTSAANVGRWSEWSGWSECSAECNGYQRVTRICQPRGASCRGPAMKKRVCNSKSKC